MSFIEQREIGYTFCRENLVELCNELLEWQKTGLLCNGKVRELSELFKFADNSAMPMAEETIKTEAMKQIVSANVKLRG